VVRRVAVGGALAVVVGVLVVGAALWLVAGDGAPGGVTETPRAGAPHGTASPTSRPVVIAHRGASAYAPHDTVAAAREAVARGADVLEVDVRQTRDGRLVALFHATLAPTTDVERVFPGRAPWRVEQFTLPEVRRLDAGRWFGPAYAGERVPTLAELREALAGSGVSMIVEVKDPARYPGVDRRLVREIRRHPDRYVEVECFDRAFLRRLDPQVGEGLVLGLTGAPPPGRLPALSSFADAVNPALVDTDAAYVAAAHEAGLEVKVWSVNEVAGMRRAAALGVDGVYTKRPDVLRRVLGR
jgi:glycerophosphoryl diester phosphodiesterase